MMTGSLEVTFLKVEGWKALTRSDTGVVLNVARGSYEVVQNIVGHELFETLSTGARLDDGLETVKAGAVCYLSARVTSRVIPATTRPSTPTWWCCGPMTVRGLAGPADQRPAGLLEHDQPSGRPRRGARANFTFRHTKNVLARIE